MKHLSLCVKLVLLFMLPITNAAQTHISGGVTTIYQISNDNNIENDLAVSADLVFDWTFSKGELYLYVEASSSPRNNGISSRLPEANADAGSALDSDQSGRIQVSEFAYKRLIDNSHAITLGLLDITAHFDQSRIASDENNQFIGVSFVQNPTIEFPDYTLGVVYEHVFDEKLEFKAAIASSNGLADNPKLSYSQLIEIDSDNKGLFSIASIARKSETWLLESGMWINTSAHETFDKTKADESNYGAYIVTGFNAGNHASNLRVGMSSDEVSLAQNFVGVSYQYKTPRWVFGAGVAKIFLSGRVVDETLQDTMQYEAYLRYRINHSFSVTIDLQNLQNSNFNESHARISDNQTLLGLRLSYLFE